MTPNGSGEPALCGSSVLGPLLVDPYGTVTRVARSITGMLTDALPWLIAALTALAVGGAICVMTLRRWRHARLARDARLVTIAAPPEVEPGSAVAFWSNLIGLLRPPVRRLITGQPHLAWEYVFTRAGLNVRVWVPGPVPAGLVARAAEAAWPGATARTDDAATPIPSGAHGTGGRLVPARADHYPLETEHRTDPLRALLGASADLADGEHVCVQVLARPVTGRRLDRARQAATRLRHGRPDRWVSRVLDTLTPGPTARRAGALTEHPERAGQIRAVLAKANRPRYACEIRYAAATTRPTTGDVARLRGRAHAVATAHAVHSGGHNHLHRRRLRDPVTALAGRRLGRGYLLSVDELAAIAHLPLDATVPGLDRAGARAIPPPPRTPRPGRDRRPLGVAIAGDRRRVALRVTDGRHHTHVIGENGTGKTTLLAGLALADARAHRGLVVIDPKGDLADRVMSNLTRPHLARVVRIDPAAPAQPVLNPLAGPDPDAAVDHLVGICRRLWPDSWGPRTDDILRASALTLARHPGRATLADIPRLLTEPHYRARVIAPLHDPVLRGFWSWFEALSAPARGQAIAPLMNRLRAVLLRTAARAVFTGTGPALDVRHTLDHGGVLIARLPEGTLGADTSRLIGSLIVSEVWRAAGRRAALPDDARPDAAVYLDECQHFLNLPHDLGQLLAEARAYRVSLTLAHQDLAQLPTDLREGVSANARNKIIFAVSPEDARRLEHHTRPNLAAHDLATLPAYTAAVRLLTDSTPAPAFTMRTLPLPADTPTQPMPTVHPA